MLDATLDANPRYERWDIFKKDLESKLGQHVQNTLWLQAKPKRPLPWSRLDLENSVVYVKTSGVNYG